MNNTTAGSAVSKPKEMLVVMTALSFIEDAALISPSQLSDAKQSLQALFIRTTGEETMLRKLIDVLKLNRDLHQAFSAISKIIANTTNGVDVVSKKLTYLKHYIDKLPLTAEESDGFFEPFLSLSLNFQEQINLFDRSMTQYLELREDEAKRTHEYRIAQNASERLRERLSGALAAATNDSDAEAEQSLKQEMLGAFDHEEALQKLREARRKSKKMSRQINEVLIEIRSMCQMAMNPEMRDSNASKNMEVMYPDVFVAFTTSLRQFNRLQQIKDFIIEHLRLFQRAYGMLVLDFDSFNRAVESIFVNPEQYFDSKIEDEDIRSKRDKLRKYEGLIPFLEDTMGALREDPSMSYTAFSRRVSETISVGDSGWSHIAEQLLLAKVAAEADVTTRLQSE